MGGKVLVHMPEFLGAKRAPGDPLTDDEVAGLSAAVRDVLVSQGMIEIEGYKSAGGASDDVIRGLNAKVDELTETVASLTDRIDAALAALPKVAKPAKTKAVKASATKTKAGEARS